jgi:hypothetical protein
MADVSAVFSIASSASGRPQYTYGAMIVENDSIVFFYCVASE